jgi:ATP-binding cassette subfamily C exporter for protease/lipase
MSKQNTPLSTLQAVIDSIKPVLKRVALFELVVNLLSLASTIYMLEVYDRVVNSLNSNTLLMLTLLDSVQRRSHSRSQAR